MFIFYPKVSEHKHLFLSRGHIINLRRYNLSGTDVWDRLEGWRLAWKSLKGRVRFLGRTCACGEEEIVDIKGKTS